MCEYASICVRSCICVWQCVCVWVLKAFGGQSLKLFDCTWAFVNANKMFLFSSFSSRFAASTLPSALISTHIYLFVFAVRVCVCVLWCGEWGWWVWWTHTGIDFATPLPDKLDINHFNDDDTHTHTLILTHRHTTYVFTCTTVHMFVCLHMYCISSLLYLKYCLNA